MTLKPEYCNTHLLYLHTWRCVDFLAEECDSGVSVGHDRDVTMDAQMTRIVEVFSTEGKNSIREAIRETLQRKTKQGKKLAGVRHPGLSWSLLWLPQISAGSPKMYWFLYTTPLSSFWRCNWAPWKKLNFKPCEITSSVPHYFCQIVL